PEGVPVVDEPSAALEAIVRRYLGTHALVGLDDLRARYPVTPGLATELLERWADEGDVVRVEPDDGEGATRWADGRNLAEVRRISVALRRKESVAVPPEVFADFLTRRHALHPETRLEGAAAVPIVLEQLQGFAAQAELWESEIFSARVEGYRAPWLDEALASGDWLWRAEGGASGEPRVAFLARGFSIDREPSPDAPGPSPDAEAVLALLSRLGASF